VIQQTVTKFRSGGELAGIGIGVPGIIEMQTGMVRESPNLPDWRDYPVRDEIERQGARPHREERAEMAHQAVLDRLTPLEFMRPRILAGHDPARVIGEVIGECRAAPVGGIRVDLCD